MSEYEIEPVRGLPETPPEDEKLLWQGTPDALAAARHILHGGWLALYFALLATSASASALMNEATLPEVASAAMHFAAIGVLALSLLVLIGWLIQRTTIYTITNKRVVMRIGIALPLTLNIPFSKIAAADAKIFGNDTGDISLNPSEPMPLTYLHLWPHARGFHLRNPQPALRCIPEAHAVSSLLIDAIRNSGVTGERTPLAAVARHQSAGAPQPVAAVA